MDWKTVWENRRIVKLTAKGFGTFTAKKNSSQTAGYLVDEIIDATDGDDTGRMYLTIVNGKVTHMISYTPCLAYYEDEKNENKKNAEILGFPVDAS